MQDIDATIWATATAVPSSSNFVMAAPPVQLAAGGKTLLELRPDGTILVRGAAATDAEIVAALREFMVAFQATVPR
jgi:hypothetical protein